MATVVFSSPRWYHLYLKHVDSENKKHGQCNTRCSDSESSALVASSSSSIDGLRITALAMAILCFWPPAKYVMSHYYSLKCNNKLISQHLIQNDLNDSDCVTYHVFHLECKLLLLQPFYSSQDFVRDNLGKPVPEETFTHSHLSWSSIIPYLLPPSFMIHGILLVQFTCLTVLFHNLTPSFLWFTS